MTSVELLRSPKAKLNRASELIANVGHRMEAYFSGGDLIETYLEADPDGFRQIIKVRLLRPPPPQDIAAVVADAIANLRSALDHLVSCLSVRNGAALKDASFPFAGNWRQFYEPGEQRKLASLSPEARRMICDLQPYRENDAEPDKGGNNMLCALNKLRNTDLHDAIVPIGLVLAQTEASVTSKAHLGLNVIEAPQRVFFADDMTAEIMRAPGKPEDIKAQVSMRVELGFGEIEPVAGYPAQMVLSDFFKLVSGIVHEAEQRFF